jgi:hypothetical protein
MNAAEQLGAHWHQEAWDEAVLAEIPAELERIGIEFR